MELRGFSRRHSKYSTEYGALENTASKIRVVSEIMTVMLSPFLQNYVGTCYMGIGEEGLPSQD